jgi:hypothetical protein
MAPSRPPGARYRFSRRWTLAAPPGAAGDNSRVRYEQDTELCQPLLRRLSPLCRPLFRANHRLMLRSARRGLAARLKGGLDPR